MDVHSVRDLLYLFPRRHQDYSEFSKISELAPGQECTVPGTSPFRKDLNPRTTILTDGMRTKSDFNHVRGSNTLKVDSSVGWFEDIEGLIYASLPDEVIVSTPDAPSNPGTLPNRTPLWRQIDDQGSRPRR